MVLTSSSGQPATNHKANFPCAHHKIRAFIDDSHTNLLSYSAQRVQFHHPFIACSRDSNYDSQLRKFSVKSSFIIRFRGIHETKHIMCKEIETKITGVKVFRGTKTFYGTGEV